MAIGPREQQDSARVEGNCSGGWVEGGGGGGEVEEVEEAEEDEGESPARCGKCCATRESVAVDTRTAKPLRDFLRLAVT
jgi:hypothetical protein